MNHFISNATLHDLQTGSQAAQDRRRIKRHPLRSRALVGIPGSAAIRGIMVDIGAGTAGIALPVSLNVGTECMVFFTVTVDGQLVAVSGAGTVINCVCSGLDGFRVGLRFQTKDQQAQDALDKLLGNEAAKPVA